jgi:GNAT superfamily N-acetyltransferase
MTDISAASFFRQAAADSGIDFEHEEIDTGGSKRPTKIHLHAVDPGSGERMGTLTYHVPRRKADKILVEHLGTEEAHRGKGVASALMDEMQRRHPATPIDHGDRTDAGKGWWDKYTDGKKVTRGRTMASVTASHPRAEVPPEQAEALEHPDFREYRRRSLELAKNPTPGTVVWRGETRTGEPRDALRSSGVGMHWTVNPDSVVVPRPHESERRVLWQGRIDNPAAQTIPRSHPSWGGRTGHSMDHEAEVRFQPGSKVHIEGAYVWHGQGDPEGHPVPRKPERTHPDWKWHPVGEHAEVRNLGHIDYGSHETPASTTKTPPPWTGADPHAVVAHEHAAGNHYSNYPGNDLDDVDWDAPEEHSDAHSNAIMTDGVVRDGWVKPHELSHEDAANWLRFHPDRAGIEQRHGGKTAMRRTAAVEEGDDVPSRLLNPHGHHIKAKVGGYRNVEMVPREEIARYASQETDPEHAKAVGHHIATTGEMEPLLLHYHPKSGEAYLGEGNHRLRASYPLQMDHLPVRVQRNNYGLPGPGVKVPQDHPALATGEHIPHDIKPSDIGLTTVEKPTMSEWDKQHELMQYRLRHSRKTAADAPTPESFARQEGEDYYDHQRRVQRGLSLGHLDYMQAREHGYTGDARQDTRDDWTGQPTPGKGWQPLPQKLYHTTTDAAGVMAHGLKSGDELGQKRGHGLGGTPEWLSLTDREDHAHNMLDALHEYHAHLNGKTTYQDLHRAAQNAEGAEKPFHEAFEHAVTGGHNEYAKDSMRRGKRLEPGFATYDEAKEKGWTPHPTIHKDFGVDKHGRHIGTGWERDPNVEERHDEYGAFSRTREWNGNGKPSILFTSNDREAFAKKDPNNFAVLHVRPKPGAHGFPMKTEHEWRTATGDAVEVHGEPIRRQAASTPVPDNHEPYQHKHDWLPHDHFFAPGKKDLDPRLFDDGERMHPEVRQYLMSLLNGFWAPRYGDSWQTWARVYLAGSEASHWYGNGDLDILIGVDYDRAREHAPALARLSDTEIDDRLNDELRQGLNDDHRLLPGPDGHETGPWENTWYVNPGSYDITTLKPYAAYDITRDQWAVEPVQVPDDFGPESLPESTWDVFDALTKLIKAIGELPDGAREREGAALYDYLHADRHSAFGPDGSGLYDPGNAVWKALDKAPGKPLQQLIDWKHAHDGAAAATDQETAA